MKKNNTPIRIQRKRINGWRMPLNTIYVGRGSKWGNPFKIEGDMIYIDAGYRRKIFNKWVFLCFGDVKKCVQLYKFLLTGVCKDKQNVLLLKNEPDMIYWINHFNKLNFKELKNKNLACWCKSEPCHADVLLKLANKQPNEK